MIRRVAQSLVALAIVASPLLVGAQSAAPASSPVPPTPWGDPDLQGVWPSTDFLGTPFQRPAEFGTRNTLTEAEFAARAVQAQRQLDTDNAEFDVETADTSNAGEVGSATSPPPHWLERGRATRQASLVVDPADGRIPPMTQAGRDRAAAQQAARKGRGPADSWEDRSLWDRCITRGVIGSILPTVYNAGIEIVQAPGYVVLRNEMIHEARVIPLDGRPAVGPRIRSLMGDSRGHWEGRTLVVRTSNMTDRTTVGAGGRHSTAATITERFTRLDADTLQYEATVDDPETWARPWTIAFPWRRDKDYQLFEYACHEGNYAMRNILSGERAREKSDGK
jgi:hypothetical protein